MPTFQTVTPMIHVPNVRATAAWYKSIGFAVLNTFEDCGEMTFAMLSYGNSQIMLSSGGRSHYQALKDRVEIRLGLQDMFYGTREFIVRDLNRFWLTFGQDLPENP